MPFDPAVRRDRRRADRERAPASAVDDAFYVYVEGPRDGEILRAFARRGAPSLLRPLERGLVILGGRRPARALEHFRHAGRRAPAPRGVVVLDRDDHPASADRVAAPPGLELFTWGRRHIESYLLVRSAIQRVIARSRRDEWVERLIESHVPPADDEAACRDIDAKRLLGSKGALAQDLGRSVSASAIARAMRRDEIHGDVLDLFDRVRDGLGHARAACQVVRRARPGRG